MAASILNDWSTPGGGTYRNDDPNGVLAIGSGDDRLLILVWLAERTSGQVNFSQMQIGGVNATGSELLYDATDGQHIYVWYWNEAAIASFADNDIDSNDGITVSNQTWSVIVFQDVLDQSNPIDFAQDTVSAANSYDVATDSTGEDWDILAVARSSANRDIDGFTNVTQAFQYNTLYTAAVADDAGGSTPLNIDIDTITDDLSYVHVVVRGGQVGAVVNRVLTENVVITDPTPGTQLQQTIPGDRVDTVTDALFLYYAYARLTQDNLTVEDAMVMEQSLRRDLGELVDLEDAVELLRQRFRSLSDSIALQDVIVRDVIVPDVGATNFRSTQDMVEVTDNVVATFLGINERQVDDAVAVADAEFLQRFRDRDVLDQIETVSDLLRLIKSKVLFDRVSVRDELVATLAPRLQQRTLSDAISVRDFVDLESGSLLPESVVIIADVEVP